MGTERQVLQDYVEALVKHADFSRYFADDVTVTIEGTDQRADGREAAEQLIRYLHEHAFDAHPVLKTCWWMRARRPSRRISSAPIRVSSPVFKLPAGQSGSRTRSSTTCAATRSASYASTSP